mmetsp:Transcript_27876/g.71089  ORF Transcript_27876/g.71089 Transcript_27876/m.71089 type:complete len:218 (-) Transcript_27876:1060-1713(-)
MSARDRDCMANSSRLAMWPNSVAAPPPLTDPAPPSLLLLGACSASCVGPSACPGTAGGWSATDMTMCQLAAYTRGCAPPSGSSSGCARYAGLFLSCSGCGGGAPNMALTASMPTSSLGSASASSTSASQNTAPAPLMSPATWPDWMAVAQPRARYTRAQVSRRLSVDSPSSRSTVGRLGDAVAAPPASLLAAARGNSTPVPLAMSTLLRSRGPTCSM